MQNSAHILEALPIYIYKLVVSNSLGCCC